MAVVKLCVLILLRKMFHSNILHSDILLNTGNEYLRKLFIHFLMTAMQTFCEDFLSEVMTLFKNQWNS